MLKISIEKYIEIFNELNIDNIKKLNRIYSNLYKNIIFKKFLLDNPSHSYYYCLHVENGRCKEEIESCFLYSSGICLNYSAYVLKDKLPEQLHNFMICKFLEGDEAAQRYFSYLENMNSNFGPWGDYK